MKNIFIAIALCSSFALAQDFVVGMGTHSGTYPKGCAYCDGADWQKAIKRAKQDAEFRCKSDAKHVGKWRWKTKVEDISFSRTKETVTAIGAFECLD